MSQPAKDEPSWLSHDINQDLSKTKVCDSSMQMELRFDQDKRDQDDSASEPFPDRRADSCDAKPLCREKADVVSMKKSRFRSVYQLRNCRGNDDDSLCSQQSRKEKSVLSMDKHHMAVTCNQFSVDQSVLNVALTQSMPILRSPHEVLIKVQVSLVCMKHSH